MTLTPRSHAREAGGSASWWKLQSLRPTDQPSCPTLKLDVMSQPGSQEEAGTTMQVSEAHVGQPYLAELLSQAPLIRPHRQCLHSHPSPQALLRLFRLGDKIHCSHVRTYASQ